MVHRSLVSVVDDDESVRESLPDLLRQFGFAAQAFSSGEAFLASDVVGDTSCLLLDLAMPGMSGDEVLERLAADPATAQIPVVIVTSHEVDAPTRARLESRARAVLHKRDLSIETLGRTLDAIEGRAVH